MQIANKAPSNTYVFSEQDLPGFADRLSAGFKHSYNNNVASSQLLLPQDRLRPTSSLNDKPRKWHPYFRKAIPSKLQNLGEMSRSFPAYSSTYLLEKTAIRARISTEITCQPVENKAYRDIMQERTRLAEKPKKETQLLSSAAASLANASYISGNPSTGDFSKFIVSIVCA